MRIAVASGKGGTGKTTVAVNLAYSWERGDVTLLDCDVEEPNCHVFLNPDITDRKEVGILVPVIDNEKCDLCGECAEFCEFNALAVLTDQVLVFPELCHGCGGCTLFCPQKAISEKLRVTGVVETGSAGNIKFVQGRLNVGEALVPPVIREVHKQGDSMSRKANSVMIIDAPPGTSCPVVTSVREADYSILVTEPTPFGVHDLSLAVEMMRTLELDFGVVINRSDIGDKRAKDFCKTEGIPILMEIPEDRAIAEVYSRGEIIVDALPQYRNMFRELAENIESRIRRAAERTEK